ncbi:MAG: hypothetical protein Q4F05_18585 [bacterium]|nr:hypothetical protein [bacterium]
MLLSCDGVTSLAKGKDKHNAKKHSQYISNEENLEPLEDGSMVSSDGNTLYYTDNGKNYKMVCEDKDNEHIISLYNEDGDLLEASVTKDDSDELVYYDYKDNNNKRTRNGPEVTTYDMTEMVEVVELTPEEQAQQEQSIADLNMDDECLGGTNDKMRATSTRYGKQYLSTEPVLDVNLTPNHSIAGTWFYLGSTTYNGVTGYLSRSNKVSGAAGKARNFKFPPLFSGLSAINTVRKALDFAISAADIKTFLGIYLVENTIRYAISERITYRPFHFTYKVQCDWDAKV